jgi:phosphatidylserine decarboxylase
MSLNNMNVKELREALKRRHLSHAGLKEDLVNRLFQAKEIAKLKKTTLEKQFVRDHRQRCKRVINDFKYVVKSNKFLLDAMNQMIDNIPSKVDKLCEKNYPGYSHAHTLETPRSFNDLCDRMLTVITSAPEYYTPKNPFTGLPLVNLFAKLIATNTGLLFFGNVIVNNYFKKFLSLWTEYLDHPASRYVLTKQEWLGMPTINEFKINTQDKYYGFKSWNTFFIRTYKNIDESRPLSKALVVAACDCHLINFKRNIQYESDYLKIKGDVYSLKDILNVVPENIIQRFVGGCIYQGYLSAENYHRYHSPVNGKLVFAKVAEGTYFLVNNFYKNNLNQFCGQNQVMRSQPFLSNVQTRAIYIFETKEIGYVAFVAIGMTEVSSCIIDQSLIGKQVKKGAEIGYFQYGGSTNVLIFEKNYCNKLNFYPKQRNFNMQTEPLTKIRSAIADLK